MSLFYRALYSREHLVDWNNGLRNSFHHRTPDEWHATWSSSMSTTCADYPLVLPCGVYTPSARSAFLEIASKRGVSGVWPPAELKRASELDGLCAFASPRGLIRWFTPTAFPSVFIEFEGSYVCRAPDGADAVVARFLREVRRWPDLHSMKTDLGAP